MHNFPLHQYTSQSVHNIDIRTSHLNTNQEKQLKYLISNFSKLFSTPDEKLTFATNVVAEIRTTSDTPVYTRPYPYPQALRGEVDKQINELIQNGIIQPSRSPYNSPIIVVSKKLDASGKKKYRIVIDYRKLNTLTIADRYPIPDINDVLNNLGQNSYFSTIDLKSGFHQIPLKEQDKEKTAFSVNGGKYEFNRLPFGLKNAPSIFQRALDDILREHVGVRCYVYIDDIIIFGKTESQHFENLEIIFKTLENANLKVQIDKCDFLKNEVEFLGFIVSKSGIKTNPLKVKSISEFPIPKTLRDLRSFLGLSGYYRRFICDYAKIAKPLTALLRGKDGRTSKSQSKLKKITFDECALEAFDKLRNTLISNEVMLTYPNFEKEFHLTTDASDYAIGAVLSQENRPITFLSRSLNKTEESYATNEKEMLAIIWALSSLRNFLYGSKKVIIQTDHQPLTHSLSNKNTNAKMRRWKAILEEYNHELHYTPGKSNVVADALSRPARSNINSLTGTVHSDESSSHNLIPAVEVPINVFRNQIILTFGNESNYQFQTPFQKFKRHIFNEKNYNQNIIINILKKYLNPNIINGLSAPENVMNLIQQVYTEHFATYKIRYTQSQVEDIISEPQQDEIIIETHNRAHRGPYENKLHILQKHYFPSMMKKIKDKIKSCSICKQFKYDRHPNKINLEKTPIPSYPGHTIHIDIFSTNKNVVLTAIDKFTKYGMARLIKSKAIEDIRGPLREIIFFYGVPEFIVVDNEKSLNSASILFMMKEELNITVFTTPPYRSAVNGQVERFHSTLAEIMRCLHSQNPTRIFEELLQQAINEYNHSIHSTIHKKPVDMFFGRNVSFGPEDYERTRLSNIEKLKTKQTKDLKFHNKTRKPPRNYNIGDIIYVRHNKRIGNKLTQRYTKEKIAENRNSTVVTQTGRIVHKDNIRN